MPTKLTIVELDMNKLEDALRRAAEKLDEKDYATLKTLAVAHVGVTWERRFASGAGSPPRRRRPQKPESNGTRTVWPWPRGTGCRGITEKHWRRCTMGKRRVKKEEGCQEK